MYVFSQMASKLLGHKHLLTYLDLSNCLDRTLHVCICVCKHHENVTETQRVMWTEKFGELSFSLVWTPFLSFFFVTNFSRRILAFSLGKLPTNTDTARSSVHSSSLRSLKTTWKWAHRSRHCPQLSAKPSPSSQLQTHFGSVIPSGEGRLPSLNTFCHLGCRGPATGSQPTPVKP